MRDLAFQAMAIHPRVSAASKPPMRFVAEPNEAPDTA
jgi:hypothetical protein